MKNKTEVAHTPGPWEVLPERNKTTGAIYIGHKERIEGALDAMTGREVPAYTGYNRLALVSKQVYGEHEANARLIAAAPELLRCLLALVQEAGTSRAMEEALKPEIEAARAAIANAVGTRHE